MKVKFTMKPINKCLLLLAKDLATFITEADNDSDTTINNKNIIINSDNDFTIMSSYLRRLMIMNYANSVERNTEQFDLTNIESIIKSTLINVLPSRDTAVRFDLPEHVMLSLFKSKDMQLEADNYSEAINPTDIKTFRLRVFAAFCIPYWFNPEYNIFVKDNLIEEFWSQDSTFLCSIGNNNINDFIRFNFIISIYNGLLDICKHLPSEIFDKQLITVEGLNKLMSDYNFSSVFNNLTKQKAFLAINLSSMEVTYKELLRTLIMESQLFLDETIEAAKVIKCNQLFYTIDKENYLKVLEKSSTMAKLYKKIKPYMAELDLFSIINQLNILNTKFTDSEVKNINDDLIKSDKIVNDVRIIDINPELLEKLLNFITILSNLYIDKLFTGSSEYLYKSDKCSIIFNKPFSLFAVGMYKDNFQTMLSNVKSVVTPLLDMRKVILPERKEKVITEKLYSTVSNILYRSIYLRELDFDLLNPIRMYENLYDIVIKELSKNGFGTNAGQIPLYLLLSNNPFLSVDNLITFKLGYANDKSKFVLYTVESEELDAMQLRGFAFDRTLTINNKSLLNVHYYVLDSLLNTDMYNLNISADFPVKVNVVNELFNLREIELYKLEDNKFASKKSFFSTAERAIRPYINKRQMLLTDNVNKCTELSDTTCYNFKRVKNLEIQINAKIKKNEKIDALNMLKKILNKNKDTIILPNITAVQLYKYLFVSNLMEALTKLDDKVQSNEKDDVKDNTNANNIELISFKFDLKEALSSFNKKFVDPEFVVDESTGLKSDTLNFVITETFGKSLSYKINEYIIQYMLKHVRYIIQSTLDVDRYIKIDDKQSYKNLITQELLDKIKAAKANYMTLKDEDNKILALTFLILLAYGADVFFDSKLYGVIREEVYEKAEDSTLNEEISQIKKILTNKEDLISLLLKVYNNMKCKNTALDAVNNLINIFILECYMIKIPNVLINSKNESQIIGAILTNLLEYR